jgi:rSAM/selenodomain-associated transferase 1
VHLADRCAIAVMAKAPRPGRVKTRLSPPLSAEQAMHLGAAFLRDVTENLALAARRAPIDGWVAYAPDGEAALFDGLLADGTQLLLADGRAPMPPGVAGMGQCLLQAVKTLLARGYGAVCVLNADSPTLPTSILARLAEELLAPGDRAVLGPADDGGYYVLGMKAPHRRLFSEIFWSTALVATQTRARAQESDVPLIELPTWYDVDDPASLRRLLAELSQARFAGDLNPFPAPATASCIQRFGIAEALGQLSV